MKPIVDCGTCIGCGLCEETCPEVFKVMEDGCAHVIVDEAPVEEYPDVRESADICPTSAITIVGE